MSRERNLKIRMLISSRRGRSNDEKERWNNAHQEAEEENHEIEEEEEEENITNIKQQIVKYADDLGVSVRIVLL